MPLEFHMILQGYTMVVSWICQINQCLVIATTEFGDKEAVQSAEHFPIYQEQRLLIRRAQIYQEQKLCD